MTTPLSDDAHGRVRTVALVIIAGVGTSAALYLGRQLFVPLALALFFNTLFRPLIRRLERWHIPAPAGAALVLLTLIAALVGAAMLVAPPAGRWMARAPQSLQTAGNKLRGIFRTVNAINTAAANLDKAAAPAARDSGVKVTVSSQQSPSATRLFGTTAGVAAGIVEVVLALYLMLASGGVFLDRLVGVIPTRASKRTAVHVAEEVEEVLAQYLTITVLLNIAQASAVGVALWLIGMPDPVLWAMLTLFLEFIPYFGGMVLVALLFVSALVSFDNLGQALLAPLSYLVLSVIQNNVASPYLYGHRLQLNAVAVLIAVLFWGFIWGVAGAFLAVPILASLKIVCDNVESLTSLGAFLSAKPPTEVKA